MDPENWVVVSVLSDIQPDADGLEFLEEFYFFSLFNW